MALREQKAILHTLGDQTRPLRFTLHDEGPQPDYSNGVTTHQELRSRIQIGLSLARTPLKLSSALARAQLSSLCTPPKSASRRRRLGFRNSVLLALLLPRTGPNKQRTSV